jgi:hypothetical protein
LSTFDSDYDREVYMVGQGEQPAKKIAKEVAQEAKRSLEQPG